MCGIIGFITNETKAHEDSRAKFLRQGLIVDTLRGDDSTGVFGVEHEPQKTGPYWCKEVSDGYSFVNSSTFTDHFWDVSAYRAAVGHNRAATMGAVDAAGAHPFIVGPITLVHNGTLHRTGNLPMPMQTIDDCVVDSHAIAHNLAEHSVADVVEKMDGAFTLVWHDARDDSMNIIRNTKRPMHIAQGMNQDTLFFASEGGMLDFVAERCGIKLGPIFYPKEGQHLKWLPDQDLTAPIVEDLELYVDDWGKLGGYGTNYAGMGGYWDSTAGVWVDDDDDDWRDDYARSKQPSGKHEPPQDDRVFVGGRLAPVPMLLQEELLKYDLVVEDRITFVPKVSMNIEEGRVQIYGLIPGGYKAVMYSVLAATAGFMKRNWTVRPIAVYVKPSGEPTIIVKLVNTHGVSSPGGTKGAVKAPTVMGYDVDEDGLELRYRGPYGVRYTLPKWLELTRDGCAMCTQSLPSIDHEDMIWIDNGNKVLCGDCAENVDMDEEIPYV